MTDSLESFSVLVSVVELESFCIYMVVLIVDVLPNKTAPKMFISRSFVYILSVTTMEPID